MSEIVDIYARRSLTLAATPPWNAKFFLSPVPLAGLPYLPVLLPVNVRPWNYVMATNHAIWAKACLRRWITSTTGLRMN